MGKIFYLMGKSASGKDTIYESLLKMGLLARRIILYTTRPPREGERDGVEYHFVDEETRDDFEKRQMILERRDYHTVLGTWSYFTVDDGKLDLTKYNYIGEGTLVSYAKLQKAYGKDALCPIYVEVEDGERLARALKRERNQQHPQYEEMCRRFLSDQKDFSEENIKEAGIEKRFYNVDFDECVKEILEFCMKQI